MIASSTLLIGVAVAVVIYYLFIRSEKTQGKKYPPGPRGLPFFGSVLSLGTRPHLVFTKWAKEYGSIVMTQLGRNRTLILSDPKLIREAFNDPLLSGRPDIKALNLLAGGKFGIIAADGEQWAEQRRFTLRNLRDFGFGKKILEDMIMEEVSETVAWLKKNAETPVAVNRKFSLAVLNSLWAIMTGERYALDDPKLNKMMETSIKTFNELSESPIPLFFPELADWFPGMTGMTRLIAAAKPMMNVFQGAVSGRLKNPGDPDHPRDFMDVYVNEMNKTTNPKSSFYKEAGIKSFVAVIGDLHGAGSETTSTTLAWAVLYLMKNPKIQKKIQDEIDKVVGKSRLPSLADKPSMPYTEAVMQEVLRMSSIVPMGVFHTALADTEFHDYFIPKDTMIIANLYYSHHNEKTWGDPDTFRPERFLSPDGKSAVKHEAVIPFSTGKRVCLGESLARDEFFLFLTSIFQRFEVRPDPKNPASLEPEVGFLSAPKVFTSIMTDRLE